MIVIKARKEEFGFTLFRQDNREYYFVDSNINVGNIENLVVKFFGLPKGVFIVEFHGSYIASNIELVAPIGMYLEIASNCNLGCKHCYKPPHISNKPLTLNDFKVLIDELYDMGVFEIRICGNEPTNSEYFFDVCQYIKGKGFYLGVNTNAFF